MDLKRTEIGLYNERRIRPGVFLDDAGYVHIRPLMDRSTYMTEADYIALCRKIYVYCDYPTPWLNILPCFVSYHFNTDRHWLAPLALELLVRSSHLRLVRCPFRTGQYTPVGDVLRYIADPPPTELE